MSMTASVTLTADEQAAYKAGYEKAVNDATMWLRDVWVPCPARWRHMQVGEVFLGAKDRSWMVSALAVQPDGTISVVARQGQDEFQAVVDPDETIRALVPTVEREALELTRAELGAQIIERRVAA
jgi:hypothetical protein